jgi:hypothetical protein
MHIAGEGRAAQFATVVAMAMGQGSRRIDLKSDAAAETTAPDHCNPPNARPAMVLKVVKS